MQEHLFQFLNSFSTWQIYRLFSSDSLCERAESSSINCASLCRISFCYITHLIIYWCYMSNFQEIRMHISGIHVEPPQCDFVTDISGLMTPLQPWKELKVKQQFKHSFCLVMHHHEVNSPFKVKCILGASEYATGGLWCSVPESAVVGLDLL